MLAFPETKKGLKKKKNTRKHASTVYFKKSYLPTVQKRRTFINVKLLFINEVLFTTPQRDRVSSSLHCGS